MADFGTIDIQPAELRGLAQTIITQRTKLDTRFNEILDKINSLESEGYKSDSGTELKNRFLRLHAYYKDKYPPAMQSYIDFLNNTAQNYEDEERKRKEAVAGLKNMGIQ